MHIANAEVSKVFDLHLHKVYSSQIRFSDPVSRPDKLTLSGRANEIQAIKSFMSTLSDIRSDRVGQLQSMVGKDSYQPSDYDIASAMIAGMSGARIAS